MIFFALFAKGVFGSLDLPKDFLPFGFPDVSFWVRIALREVGLNRLDQFTHARKAAVANTIDGEIAEEAFDEIHP